MRKALAALTTISLVGTLFLGSPAPAVAADGDTTIGSAKVSDHSGDTNIVHVADALETAGQDQLYLVDPSSVISLHLDMTSADARMDDGIVDNFTLTLANGSFGANFTDIRVADGTCDLAWTNTSTTVRSGAIDCDEDGADGHEISVLFFVTAPATGSAVLTVTDAGSTFKVYFMAEEEDDDIYVGQDADLAAGAGSCGAAGPDFSTTNVTQDLDVQQAIDFALQSINEDGDTVIICNGTYGYEGDIREYLGSDLYAGTLTIEAQTSGSVTFDGDGTDRLLRVVGADLSVEGINFLEGQSDDGGAIYVGSECGEGCFGGSLDVLDAQFNGNVASDDGGAIYADGSLTVNHTEFNANDANDYGGAIYVDGFSYTDDQVIVADVEFDSNEAVEGGAIWVENTQLTVLRSYFTDNYASEVGGAIYAYDSDWSVADSTFGSADDDHEDPDLENAADEGGDIYSATGFIANAVTASITNSSFYDSRSTDGDGASLFLECTAASINNSLFHSTEADADGVIKIDDDGGCEDYRVSIRRTTFTDNYANSDGVIFVNAGSESDGISGLLSLSVTNSLFTGNVAEEDEGVFDVEGPVDISIINSRFERNSTGDNGAIIEMDGGDDDSDTTNGSLTFSRNQVRFNTGGTDSENGDGMIQLDDVHSWQIDYNTFQGNSADRGAVLAFEVDEDDLRDLIQLNGFRRNTIIGNSASVGGSYLFIQYNDNASNVNRASIKRIEQQVKKNRNVIKGGTRPQILQLLDFLAEPG